MTGYDPYNSADLPWWVWLLEFSMKRARLAYERQQ